jgi:dienelactone hydrolase
MSGSTWRLRDLLSPVVARLLIQGANPMDLEGALSRLEAKPVPNAKALESNWLSEWGTLQAEWIERAGTALAGGPRATARTCLFHATTCALARFLVNTSDLSLKEAVYRDYAATFRRLCDLSPTPVEDLVVPCRDGSRLSAQLHLPVGEGPHPCAVVYSGLGACKEEMRTLASALVERGVAALVPDMPGSGMTLFEHGSPCAMPLVESAISALADRIESDPRLCSARIGAMGLCMGGGFAFRAVALDGRYRGAALLFPLFVGQTVESGIPSWMRSGPWVAKQVGGVAIEDFMASMVPAPTDRPRVPTLIVHGRHDNWMTWEAARSLHERVESDAKEFLTIEDSPVVTGGNATTHAMPVGEKMHWVAPLAADWTADRLFGIPA